MNELLYKVEGVTKTIVLPTENLTILKGVELEIKRGESVAIVGASGSGKSTLLHILGGLDKPSSGRVFFKGTDLTSMDESQMALFRNKYIGFVFQFHHLLAEFNVLDNVAMPMIIRGIDKKKAYERAGNVLSLVGMGDKKKQMVNTLSGGERQLVAVARSLVGEPEVILADEPTGNLDLENAEKIGEIFTNLNRDMGLTIILVTHNMELAHLMGRVLKLKDGKIQ
ncbi:ABC transporter ATP-binding protein [Desulfothermus okinawensis JCM 13304]